MTSAALTSVFRPYRLHAVHRHGLLLQMSHVAWSVCRSHGWAVQKTAEPIEMPFWVLTCERPSQSTVRRCWFPNYTFNFIEKKYFSYCV